MAIEREEMPEEMTEEGMSEVAETVSLPPSILGGQTVAPGDIVRLEVVEVGEDGSVSVKYATESKSETPARGESAIAAAFE